jgi:hypothetical protein
MRQENQLPHGSKQKEMKQTLEEAAKEYYEG